MAKRITKKEKEELSKKGICWKCGKKTISCDVHGIILCENCGLKVIRY